MTNSDPSQLDPEQAESSRDDHKANRAIGHRGHWSQFSLAGLLAVQTVSAVIFALCHFLGIAIVISLLVLGGSLLAVIIGTVLVALNFRQVGILYDRYSSLGFLYSVVAISTFAGLTLLAKLWK